MVQTATFFVLEIKDLEFLRVEVKAYSGKKKSWLGMIKKSNYLLSKKLDSLAVEKINYRWSGLAFAILAVFSKEKLETDWGNLEYSSLANELSEKREAGIYIFSIKDEGLFKIKPTGHFYSIDELDQFAIEFEGTKPGNEYIMKHAVEMLNQALSKLTKERVALLLIE